MIKQTGILALIALLVLAMCSCQEAPRSESKVSATAPPASAVAPDSTAPKGEMTMAKSTYNVEGMTCESCVNGITETLSAMPGVAQCQVDLAGHCAKVEYDPAQVDDAKLIDSINALGYTATLAASKPDLSALAGDGCGGECSGGECSGECGDPVQGKGKAEGCADGGCGGCGKAEGKGEGMGAGMGRPEGSIDLPDMPQNCLRQSFFVEGLDTAENLDKLIASINALDGVEGTHPDPAQMRVVVDYHPETDVESIKSALAGFGLKLMDHPPARGKASPSESQDA